MNQGLKLMNEWFKSFKQCLKSRTPMCEILVSKMYVCAMRYVLVPVVLQWDVIVLYDGVPDVFVMGAFQGCLLCMSVFIISVCRIDILDVCVFDDCVPVLGMRHLCLFKAQIWNVCLQNVCDQCLFGEWLCGFNILFLMGSFVLDSSVRDLSMWMAEFSLCVSRISALDECLLDNCLKNVTVLKA